MRRKHTFYVGGPDAFYDRKDWNRLAAALPKFYTDARGPRCEPDLYRNGTLGVAQQYSFGVYRADDKPLRNDEINALSWFFHGVCVALDIHPVHIPSPKER